MTSMMLENAVKNGLYEKIDSYEHDMVRELIEMIAIPSLPTYVTEEGMQHGPEIINCLHYALDLSEKLGFRTHNENDLYGWAEVGESGPLVAIFTHLDIVPVGENWTKDPFKASMEGDVLYGRGSIDNKGPAVSTLYALKACCDMGYEWPCRVRVYFGTNEETGMKDVKMYIAKYGVPDYSFVPDSQFPLSYSELSGLTFTLRKNFHPDRVVSDIKVKNIWFEPHVNGIPAHSSCTLSVCCEKAGKDVVDHLTAFATENDYDMTACINEDGDVFIQSEGVVAYHWNEPWTAVNSLAHIVLFLATISVGEEADELIRFVASRVGNETDGKSLGLEDKRETGDFCMGLREFLLDDYGMYCTLNCLFSAEINAEIILAKVFDELEGFGLKVEVNRVRRGFVLDKDSPFLQGLYKSYCEVTGNSDPIKVCGGTYGKFVPRCVPFGAIFGPEQDICHTPDEHIRVKSEMMVWTKIYANAILRTADAIADGVL